ncbi:hypothetical protein ABOM_002869 [Aspergillus bombycis]|uniref:DUF7924 domain-containing protein n=1 Tax=Aspergillus bombycis TaxID=109264 RepID=A0A1F8A9P9_9EURO|nr:hypothetical protein ABOM_002869 [Aspergillus bombycis]OGM48129.1 hypothetical protein ABOM_002869 [Aspergillus bombycis]
MKRLISAREDPSNKRRQIQLENKPPSPVSIPCRTQDIPAAVSRSNAIRETDQEDSIHNRIFNWIPLAATDFDPMERPPSKRSRSVSSDRDRESSGPSEGSRSRSSSRDARSSAYRDTNYATILETKNCYMRNSATGPAQEDIELCKQLLQQEIEVPQETMFQSEHFDAFHDALQDRSEMRLLIDLHPMLMPSAENQFIRGRLSLKNVIDGYNDPWIKAEPIYGPKPQPDHTRGLRWSTFNESQRKKLGVQPNEKSLYTAREEIYFPYLVGEVKSNQQALDIADRQNMHSACVALRGLVHLSRMAGCVEILHRRILAFSISHDGDIVRIYGHYPEIEDDKVSYYRWRIGKFDIWTDADKWTCYRFVYNLDDIFLPSHIARVMDMLERIPEPQDISSPVDLDATTEVQSVPGSEEEESTARRNMAVRSRGLQPEIRAMVQSVQKQVERLERERQEQKGREEKLHAQLEQERRERLEQEEKLHAQFQREREEQKQREERLRAQFEQERREQKETQERLITQFERLAQTLSPK